ncbi:NB-ARC domain-containing protein [Streptomyces sp. LX-29]|uniref:NB-ARC domain-containing protein n=1 Tax=Streptomyces sp. LX-29 TaxID=2900152 RepID=UPI00240D919D|nr:NB-ARC domain-containing protein [Streptomyces sp. LX-29]WFB08200.1 NB-ARC domain-containing protein [Streptomyces sp. LX-29]
MGTVQRWTGEEARALRQATRQSVRRFAAYLGVSDRTVSNWEARGKEIVLAPDSQALLDTALERSDADVQQRFWGSVGAPIPAPAAAPDNHLPIPVPEPGLVHRSDDFEGLVAVLREASAADGIATVAVCGPGGFGKTTLATQVCHDPRIRESFSEILWVETGEGCTAARVVELISDLCVHLDGSRPALTDPEQAGFHLARLLQGRQALLVIDNVWSAADLGPFLLGGEDCVRLVTTRNVRVCPTAARVVRLGPMTSSEISELLTRNVGALKYPEAARLADVCGGWPLLAAIVGANVSQDVVAGASAARVATEASEVIRTYGPQAFDVWDSDQRKNAIGQALASSLRSLDENVSIGGISGLRDRYLSLAIFPPAAPIPVSVLAHWWHTTHGWSPHVVRQFCRVLSDRSLVSAYLADRDAIVLHDVFRSYLRHLVGDHWAALHRSLVEAYRQITDGGWETLGDAHTYLWRHLPYHLREADLDAELVSLLASPSYVLRKVSRVGHQALTADAAVLDALPRRHEDTHPQHQVWNTARMMAGAGYLLSGLEKPADLASTLSIVLRRSPLPASAQALDHVTGSGPVLEAKWLLPPEDAAPESVAPGHVGAVVSVSVVRNLVVSGGEDGVVRLWDLDTGRFLRAHQAHTGWVFATALSPDGLTIASAGDDAVIRLWRTDTGDPLGVLTGHTRRIRGLAFSSSGSVLVSGAEDGAVCAWDTDRLVLMRKMHTAGTPMWSVAIGGESDSAVAAVGEDEFVRLFDLTTGRLLDERAAHRDWVRTVAFAPGSSLLASGSGDRSVLVWNTADGQLAPIRRIADLKARVRSVTLSPRAEVAIAATEEPRIQAFSAEGPVGETQLPPGVDWVRSVARTDDGRVIAGCEDGGVRVWNAGRGQLETLGRGSNTVWSTQFAADGRIAVVGDGAGNVGLFDASTSAFRRRLPAGHGRVWSLAGGTHHVAAACGDGTVRVWSLVDTGWDLTLNQDATRTWAVAMARSVPRLAASTGDGHIRCWDLPSGSLLWSQDVHAGRLRSIAFDDSGDLLAACGGDGSVRVWHASTGEFRGRFTCPSGWARAVTVDGLGNRVAVGAGTGDISVRDLRTDRFTAHLSGHTGRILMLGFTSDESRLISAAADGTVRLWALDDQRQIAEVRVDASLHCAAFDSRTGAVLVGSAAGVVALDIKDT